ncbi:MAG TPA: bifunctional riboflavin kinase/FAD synthetase [bacterium]|nr:bifunctional riboflavin kinase/FAD synthetase [bacterium]
MELVLGIDKVKKRHRGGILALGTFDGVHLGHQKVIKSLKRRAKRLKKKSIVLTFDIHPLKTVDPAKCPPLLTPKEEKINLIQDLGIDLLILANFNKRFSSFSPEKFVKDILVDRLGIEEVFVGKDFIFGKGGTGNITFLKNKSREYGFGVKIIPPEKAGKITISSTKIRELIKEGKVKKAALLLGRPYTLYGRVVHGESRGRELGYPTANIRPHYEVIPSDGVYLGKIRAQGKDWDGLLNIGAQPTFHKGLARVRKGEQGSGGEQKRVIEAYIFDFNGKIYGREIKVSFLKKIRNEIAFKNPESLKAQIKKDIVKARKILSLI